MNTTETKVTHTPGPWSWQRQPHRFRLLSAGGEETGLAVAVLSSEDEMFPESANARLIAAAPELLASLRIALTWAETYQRTGATADDGPLGQDIARIRAAIAKAEGRAL